MADLIPTFRYAGEASAFQFPVQLIVFGELPNVSIVEFKDKETAKGYINRANSYSGVKAIQLWTDEK